MHRQFDMLAWDDLNSFLAIARHGTLSAAARALGVRQTTMGRRLAALEARAGARLLQKTPRGYVMTQAGEAILGNVERIEGEALAIERRITGRDIRLEGNVRITTVESLAVELLLPALAEFRTRHPGITLDLVTDTRSLSLTNREADIAIRMARPRQQELAVRRIGGLGFGLYASAAYIAAAGAPDFASGAPGHSLILNPPELMELPEMAWFAGIAGQGAPVLRTNSRYAQCAAAVNGIGIAVLSRYLGDPAPLVRLPTPAPPPTRDIWLAVHNDIRHMPRIRAVTDFLAATLRGASARLHPNQ